MDQQQQLLDRERLEAGLVEELRAWLAGRLVDVELVAATMLELSHAGHIARETVDTALRENNIFLERKLLARWCSLASSSGSTCSLDTLIHILTKAVNPILEVNYMNATLPEGNEIDFANSLFSLDNSQYGELNEIDNKKRKDILLRTEVDLKTKHIGRLKQALYTSYKQRSGYLPPEEVLQLSQAFR